MLSMTQMIILVVTVIIAGAMSSILLYWLENRKEKMEGFQLSDFTENSTYMGMANSDVAVDEIIRDFKLLD